ncbi:trypsin-like peptidase domain-containing protein [Ideonella sp. BN130291]|uniref:trypsin-like peptidase domain-containing protein n=1 Tax=Ideonella sp. BN130291 TaxID=3112940 RepID=UPI002E25561D|nr:trypsin-like peptidase domain-containing protein [Ideonella sp. BN130291]
MQPFVHGDPERRAWIEVSSANPAEVERLKPTLVAFLAFDRERMPRLAGTGFVIAGDPGLALVATAKHVLTEGVSQFQGLGRTSSPSAIFVPDRINVSLSPEHLKAVWVDGRSAGLLDVHCASYNASHDVAVCAIGPQEREPPPFDPRSVPFHTELPSVGDPAQMVAIDEMKVGESEPPSDRTGQGQVLIVSRRVSIRLGVVTGVFPRGLRQYRWPCFTTSIPAEPGMSGGYLFIPKPGTTVAACGVVCADASSDEARINQSVAGESIIGCTWPALGLSLPEHIGQPKTRTLLEMAASGEIPMPVGGVEHIGFTTGAQGEQAIQFGGVPGT